ncbi:hypothetical protein QJS10_CPA03g02284 [Acorus calamus]|uniref:Uncharacterized protein n=1 Tax=Acorus calamus TaxID=4465 RepID=A0AAV9F300_ACOCL|nr:hypothetical protein QJS10_CPA03g02284 [Acorus calamus]
MKLREKQAKLERMLSFNKSGKGSPFQEPSTHIRGMIDVSGALLVMGDADEQTKEVLCRTGIKTGMESRFVFHTVIRHKDALMAEFVACHSGHVNNADIFQIPLSLDKVMYSANISDSLSAIAIPLGARCKDFEIGAIPLKRRLFAEHPSSHPPTFNQYHGYAAGCHSKAPNSLVL